MHHCGRVLVGRPRCRSDAIPMRGRRPAMKAPCCQGHRLIPEKHEGLVGPPVVEGGVEMGGRMVPVSL